MRCFDLDSYTDIMYIVVLLLWLAVNAFISSMEVTGGVLELRGRSHGILDVFFTLYASFSA